MKQTEVDVEKVTGEEINDADDDDYCPVKQVAMTVPTTDDPTLPVYTFRMWFLGLVGCVFLAFVNQFYWYRTEPLMVTSTAVQIAVVPIGHLMAAAITKRRFFEGRWFAFSLNPGPFNMKEHVLITIFANAGAGTVYATHIVSAVKLFYKRSLGFLPAFLVMMTTQMLGYGWAGLFRKYLVEPAEMWWPGTLVQVSIFRALHEKEKRSRGGVSRTQFFLIGAAASFAYYIVPGHFFTLLVSISWVCWLAPKSVTVQQIGSGMKGMGLFSFGLDWSTITSYLGSPLASPWFASANVAVGFVLVVYVMVPLGYWTNLYSAKNFPIFSSSSYTHDGRRYNTTIITTPDFHLDRQAYTDQGKLYLSTFFALTYGVGFAALPATLVHVFLFHGRDVWRQMKSVSRQMKSGIWPMFSWCLPKKSNGEEVEEEEKVDVHTRLMNKYKQVPTLWFMAILVGNIVVILFAVEYYKSSLQLPWWGVLLACCIALLYTLPIGIISATTNQQPGLNIITEYVFGYLYPGYPVANMCFKVYGYISMTQALTFIADFKLGHYMKIPPRAMFNVQVVGTVVSVIVYTCTAWWLMESIPNLCDTAKLGASSQWTCPIDNTFYTASILWGLVGPQRMFGNLGVYPDVNWFFLGGAVAPLLVWLAARAFPNHKWIPLVHVPLILSATAIMPPATTSNFTSWIAVAFVFGFVLYRRRPDWWSRYNYVLSGALEFGTAMSALALFLVLGSVAPAWWGNDGEGCPLATCPTAKGIVVHGCPVF